MNKKEYTLVEKNIWQHNIDKKRYIVDLYVLVRANSKPYSVKWINGRFTKF